MKNIAKRTNSWVPVPVKNKICKDCLELKEEIYRLNKDFISQRAEFMDSVQTFVDKSKEQCEEIDKLKSQLENLQSSKIKDDIKSREDALDKLESIQKIQKTVKSIHERKKTPKNLGKQSANGSRLKLRTRSLTSYPKGKTPALKRKS